MHVGLLVAIEGIDGTGKGTQARRLADALAAAGYRTRLISFPRYNETTFGRRIGEYLNGRYGALHEVHPLLVALLYAGDRFESRELLRESRDACDVVILDRYVASNVAHQGAKRCGGERDELRSFIEKLEFELYELPRPDLVILLDLPAAQAQELVARKTPRGYTDRTRDLQEENLQYLEEVRQLYLQESEDTAWRRVDVSRDGVLRSIADIGDEIYEVVAARLRDRPSHRA